MYPCRGVEASFHPQDDAIVRQGSSLLGLGLLVLGCVVLCCGAFCTCIAWNGLPAFLLVGV